MAPSTRAATAFAAGGPSGSRASGGKGRKADMPPEGGAKNGRVKGRWKGGDKGLAVDLSTALTSEVLGPLLASATEVSLYKLEACLPAGERGQEVTAARLLSPQFQQELTAFCEGLQSGQLGSVCQAFGLGGRSVAAAGRGDLAGFVREREAEGEQGIAARQEAAEARKEARKTRKEARETCKEAA
jgi:hypothetical protein